MANSKLSNTLKGLMWIKGSILVAAMGAFWAYEHNGTIRNLEYNVLDKKQVVEEKFFQDPPGLRSAWYSNEKGNVQTYLEYVTSDGIQKRVEVMDDMLPNTNTMMRGLYARGKKYTADVISNTNQNLRPSNLSKSDLEKIAKNSFEIFKKAVNERYFNGSKDLGYISFDIKDGELYMTGVDGQTFNLNAPKDTTYVDKIMQVIGDMYNKEIKTDSTKIAN